MPPQDAYTTTLIEFREYNIVLIFISLKQLSLSLSLRSYKYCKLTIIAILNSK